ncbi:hypothetical protein AYR66_08525 [Noviherbaspirillum denitrificans]|uniref:Uncharacterized protein n=1 Tax=Noviherbaspirillum denitrificans TaxID=1968433 RepID=A0A254TG99_9BURK|nr:hypothetical protein AYR66_08525 [Noviherbaspirillum denitrificans]
MFGARGQVEVAAGDLGRGVRDLVGTVAYLGHDAGQVVVHDVERLQQVGGLILACHFNARAEVAGCNGFGKQDCLVERDGDAVHQPVSDRAAEADCADAHRQQKEGRIAVALLRQRHAVGSELAGLFDHVSDDVVDLLGWCAVHAAHEAVDDLRAFRVGGVVLFGGVQVFRAQFAVCAGGIVDQCRVEAEPAQLGLELVQAGLGFFAFLLEFLCVFFKCGGIVAAQQEVFPFLYLDLEFDLREARGIDGIFQQRCTLHGGNGIGIGLAQGLPSTEAYEENR